MPVNRPIADCASRVTTGKDRPITPPCNGRYRLRVRKGGKQRAFPCIPKPESGVAGSSQDTTIWGEYQLSGMTQAHATSRRPHERAGGNLPYGNFTVCR